MCAHTLRLIYINKCIKNDCFFKFFLEIFCGYQKSAYLCTRFRGAMLREAKKRKSTLKDLHKTDTNSSTRSECLSGTWVKEANRHFI